MTQQPVTSSGTGSFGMWTSSVCGGESWAYGMPKWDMYGWSGMVRRAKTSGSVAGFAIRRCKVGNDGVERTVVLRGVAEHNIEVRFVRSRDHVDSLHLPVGPT